MPVPSPPSAHHVQSPRPGGYGTGRARARRPHVVHRSRIGPEVTAWPSRMAAVSHPADTAAVALPTPGAGTHHEAWLHAYLLGRRVPILARTMTRSARILPPAWAVAVSQAA